MTKRGLWVISALLIVLTLLFTACVKVEYEDNEPTVGATEETAAETTESTSEEEKEEVEEAPAEPTATLEPKMPDTLVLHPDAYDVEISEVSHTYIYQVPLMVKETMEFLQAELKAKGWEELGKPVLMGHLATLNFKMGGDRLSVSMQDNEISQTTRVQMLLLLGQ